MSDFIDADGYPTEQALKRIEEWDYKDAPGWFEFIESIWWGADWGLARYAGKDIFGDNQEYIFMSTGGWSGNEDILYSMKKNRFLWALCWHESRRGGHYRFEIHKPKKDGKHKEPAKG